DQTTRRRDVPNHKNRSRNDESSVQGAELNNALSKRKEYEPKQEPAYGLSRQNPPKHVRVAWISQVAERRRRRWVEVGGAQNLLGQDAYDEICDHLADDHHTGEPGKRLEHWRLHRESVQRLALSWRLSTAARRQP